MGSIDRSVRRSLLWPGESIVRSLQNLILYNLAYVLIGLEAASILRRAPRGLVVKAYVLHSIV